jgi:hypothetical protein
MLEPQKPGDGGTEPTDPAQQKDSTKQVDSSDMNLEEGDGGTEPTPPPA